jgi:hypothetical protein
VAPGREAELRRAAGRELAGRVLAGPRGRLCGADAAVVVAAGADAAGADLTAWEAGGSCARAQARYSIAAAKVRAIANRRFMGGSVRGGRSSRALDPL